MSIVTVFRMDDEDETFITQSTLKLLPRVGDTVWVLPNETHKAYEVVDVCHWVSAEDMSYHTACVYLKEVT